MSQLIKGLILINSFFILTGCRPPSKLVKNKAKFYKSTNAKNILKNDAVNLTEGTFQSNDDNCTNQAYFLIRFNNNQTVQLAKNIKNSNNLSNIDNSNLLEYLKDEVSYYFYIDAKQTLVLERFEYWQVPWWNFFGQAEHYLTEKFTILGDTLVNQEKGRFTRFCKSYVLDRNLINNFETVKNEFTKKE
ncbi:MAG: hypothetical protein JJU02_07845 [Cryomorphaceae bacterium]|nr:hypothetical protein [Cryomorphaceae bacterium]